MSGRLSLPRWTSHPALRAFGFVLVVRDIVLAAVALGGLVAGGLAHHDTLSIVALGLAALALAGVVASSIVEQRRAANLAAGHHVRAPLYSDEGPTQPRVPERHDELQEQASAHVASRSAVADEVSSGKKLKAEMADAQERGAWDDEGWAYRKRVEAWTERAVNVLERCGRDDVASALAEVEAPPRPPFEILLEGYSPAYARLVGLLDGRIGLLEELQG